MSLFFLGNCGNTTLPTVLNIACQHFFAKDLFLFSLRYLAIKKRPGVNINAVELACAEAMHF